MILLSDKKSKSFIPFFTSPGLTFISGRFNPRPFFSKVSLAVFSAILEAFSPCKIFVASLANNILSLFISFSLLQISSILPVLISVKKYKNFLTSRSSVFLQNCQYSYELNKFSFNQTAPFSVLPIFALMPK